MMKKNLILWILCVLMLSCTSFSVWAQESEDDLTITNGCHSVDANMPLLGQGKLINNAQSIFLYETNSDSLLYAWNADAQMYPASLVKIMTALLVLERGTLSDEVTVQKSALNAVSSDAISVNLQVGEVLTVEQLLYCMLVQSANDAAAVLAEHISGTQTEFVELMNQRAQEIGCTGTVYTNAHGLHNDRQLTTAKDTCRILLEALKFDEFRKMFGTVYYTVPATNLHSERFLATKNYFMNTDEFGIHSDNRVTGGRTGTTTNGFQCVASLSRSGNMELICVVMGARSEIGEDGYSIKNVGGFPETSALLDIAYGGYTMYEIVAPNQILSQQAVTNGDSDVFLASHDGFSTVIPKTMTPEQLVYRYGDSLHNNVAPIEKGQPISELQVWYQSFCLAQTDVYAMNKVTPITPKVIVPENDGRLHFLWIVLIVFVVFLVLAGVCLVGIRYYHIRKHQRMMGKRNPKRRK